KNVQRFSRGAAPPPPPRGDLGFQTDPAGFEFFFRQPFGSLASHGHGFNPELAEAFRKECARGIVQLHQGGARRSFASGGHRGEWDGSESFIHSSRSLTSRGRLEIRLSKPF